MNFCAQGREQQQSVSMTPKIIGEGFGGCEGTINSSYSQTNNNPNFRSCNKENPCVQYYWPLMQ